MTNILSTEQVGGYHQADNANQEIEYHQRQRSKLRNCHLEILSGPKNDISRWSPNESVLELPINCSGMIIDKCFRVELESM